MIKKAIQVLLLGFLLVFVNLTTPALSQEQPQTQEDTSVVTLPVMVQCGLKETIMESIVLKYNELPFAKMLVSFTVPSGQLLSGYGTIWVNASTGSWSYVVTFPDNDRVCYFFGGKDFGPATQKGTKS